MILQRQPVAKAKLKKMKTFILLLMFPFYAFCQETDEDGNYILRGTTVLQWSDKYRQTVYQYGYYLQDLNSSGCENQGERIEELRDTVLMAYQSDSVVTISIKKISNCTDQFLGEIEIVNDSIINVITHGYGGHSTCSCCFGLEFVINTEGINEKIRYVMIDSDEKTMAEIE